MARKRRIPIEDGMKAVRDYVSGDAQDAKTIATAVRFLLEELANIAPGASIEVRVPPYGATQCGFGAAGPQHTRGTPPNIIETDPETWIAIATGQESWETVISNAKIMASGTRANLGVILPLIRL